MIDTALEFIRIELRGHLGVTDGEVVIGSAKRLTEENNAEGAYIALVNIEEERALRKAPNTEHEPPVPLSLYVLFAFSFGTYEASLLHLGSTVKLFQSKRFFDASTQTSINPMPPGLERLAFDVHNMAFDQLSRLWGMHGGSYVPSVVYRVHLRPSPTLTRP